MKCSKTFLRCINPMVWASLCIFLPLMGLIDKFSTKVGSQNAHKMSNFKYPLSIENGLLFYDDTHPLLMNCSQTFLIYMKQMGGASLCILLPLMGLTKLCSTKVDSQIAQNTRCWVRPLSTKIACCSKERDIHCLWIASKPSWDARDWWEELLIASGYQLLVQLSHFYQGWLSNCTQNAIFWIPSRYRKWDDVLPWETSIAHEVFQYLP